MLQPKFRQNAKTMLSQWDSELSPIRREALIAAMWVVSVAMRFVATHLPHTPFTVLGELEPWTWLYMWVHQEVNAKTRITIRRQSKYAYLLTTREHTLT